MGRQRTDRVVEDSGGSMNEMLSIGPPVRNGEPYLGRTSAWRLLRLRRRDGSTVSPSVEYPNQEIMGAP